MNGKKTYLTAAASLVYAAVGYFLHLQNASTGLDASTALQIAQVAVMGAFIRHGVSNG